MAKFLDPDDLWKPFGAFSHVAVAGGTRLVLVKGQIPLNREGQLVGRGNMRLQIEQVCKNLETALAAVGTDLASVLELRIFTTDIDAFAAASDIRTEWFDRPYPVTTTVEVRRLMDPEIVVEIAATAEIVGTRIEGGHDGRS